MYILEKEMATHSSTLAWKIPRMEERGRLQSMGPQRVGHDWATSLHPLHTFSLEKEMATHSSTLAWKIPWMEERGRLQSMGLQRVGHDWATSLTSYFLTGEGNGNPLQYSYLENPMERGAWRAMVHGVVESQTWLEWLSMYIYLSLKENEGIGILLKFTGRKSQKKFLVGDYKWKLMSFTHYCKIRFHKTSDILGLTVLFCLTDVGSCLWTLL